MIPEMTHPLGRYWDQPNKSAIEFSFGKAWISKEDFQKLAQYDASIPSGVYAGKMWKREFNRKTKYGKLVPSYLLCWYQDSAKPEHFDIKQIELIVK